MNDFLAGKEYESFLTWAFGLKEKINLSQMGDPAGAADTDSFVPENLAAVKAATAYGMMIYEYDIKKRCNIPLSESNRFVNYVQQVINSSSLEDISDIIFGFNESVVNRYYERIGGISSFKQPIDEPL